MSGRYDGAMIKSVWSGVFDLSAVRDGSMQPRSNTDNATNQRFLNRAV
jgi:hypothetical protein